MYNNELIGTGTLDGSGNGTITYAITNPGSIVELTISKHNSKPYHSTLNVTGSCGFPPAVSTDAVSGIGSETATGNGEIVNDYGSTVTECGFVSGTDPSPVIGGAGVIQTITSPLVTSGIYSETISGLSPFTSYYTRAYATNGNGTGYGGDLSFTTLCSSYSLPFSEDFSGGSLPNCWTQQSQNCTDRWWVESTNNAGGSAGELRCLWEEVSPATTRLVSPELNTVGISSMDLSFIHFFDDWGAGATIKIQSSTDGVNWTDESWSYTSGSGNLGPETVNVNITNNLNSPGTLVAFMITGDLYQFDNWYVDDVLFDAVYPGRWTGSVSDDWDNTSNWSNGQVPDETTDVVLSTGSTNYPMLNGDLYVNNAVGAYRCHSLTIRHGATLNFSSTYQIQVFGNVTIEDGGTMHVGN